MPWRVWAGLVTSGCHRKDSSETRPYTINIHVAPHTVKVRKSHP
ncbi:hypothetical protein MC7420_4035 [Coleofasciculus chthonoplastes PCC 7420]|uniref:Uncharacterized protein n=1 Tax=Coleofasciculus chthonoplastes PCC 7420 TaxID=118168 RepID=B4VUQ3_9CYAN|nr:hypothetical protein MC7420_4035 [Coleofasciculus chthonoplastes PCC 7420]